MLSNKVTAVCTAPSSDMVTHYQALVAPTLVSAVHVTPESVEV